jgi:hypothetical protein
LPGRLLFQDSRAYFLSRALLSSLAIREAVSIQPVGRRRLNDQKNSSDPEQNRAKIMTQ